MRANRLWSEAEIAQLAKLLRTGQHTAESAAEIFGRSPAAIVMKARRLQMEDYLLRFCNGCDTALPLPATRHRQLCDACLSMPPSERPNPPAPRKTKPRERVAQTGGRECASCGEHRLEHEYESRGHSVCNACLSKADQRAARLMCVGSGR